MLDAFTANFEKNAEIKFLCALLFFFAMGKLDVKKPEF